MNFRALCHGYALHCYFVYLDIPVTRPLLMRKQNVFVLLICNCKKQNLHLFK